VEIIFFSSISACVKFSFTKIKEVNQAASRTEPDNTTQNTTRYCSDTTTLTNNTSNIMSNVFERLESFVGTHNDLPARCSLFFNLNSNLNTVRAD
jgi:hypothetical protein